MVVLLGTPNAESSRLYGLTVTEGDPAWAGVLAGVRLDLPVYHIVEPEIKAQVEPGLYQEHVGLAALVLETEEILQALEKIRQNSE